MQREEEAPEGAEGAERGKCTSAPPAEACDEPANVSSHADAAEAMAELLQFILRSVCEAQSDSGDEDSEGEDPSAAAHGTKGRGAKKKAKEKAKDAAGFVLCDLCNTIVEGSVPQHMADEHGDVGLVRGAHDGEEETPGGGAVAAGAGLAHRTDGPHDAAAAALDAKMGAYAHLAVAHADRGAEMFAVIVKATEQMRTMVESEEDGSRLYLFGSCVTMGLWDGVGDADFTVYLPRSAEDDSGEPSHRAQQDAILHLARKLRYGGFQFAELEPVVRARVPVVRRKRDTKRPHELRRQDEPYLIEFIFTHASKKELFLRKAADGVARAYRGEEVKGEATKTTLVYAFTDGVSALKLFSRRERVGEATKRWKRHCRLPEIFSVDFDLSCRTFGIRNSWFLRRYMEQSPLFRAGSLFVKQWSRQCGINNSRAGFLTSYAVSNLWVYYLLRTGHAAFVEPTALPRLPTAEAYGDVPYMPLWPYAEDDKAPLAALGALLRGFFRFYATVFDWEREVVSLRHDCSPRREDGGGGVVRAKADLGWTGEAETDSIILRDRIFYRVCIEDVYEANLNLARHLSPHKAEWFTAQFRLASAWCHSTTAAAVNGSGTWASLLSDGYLQRAEATLRTAVWRQLLLGAGSLTVRELKAALRASHADLLPTYELFHRLSELWHDYDAAAADAAANKRHNRLAVETPPAPDFGEDEDHWAAVSGATLCPFPPDRDPIDRDNRLVFLANGRILPRHGHGDTAADVAARLAEAQPLFRAAAAAVSETLDTMRTASEGDGRDAMALPADVRKASPLVTHAFFTVDGLAFGTYRARDTFLKHLSAVAECLANPETARRIAEALHGKHRSAGAAAVAPIVATLYGRTSGESVNAAIVSFIFSRAQYVRRNRDTGHPEPTDLLRTHLPTDTVEEDKSRVSRAPLITTAAAAEGKRRRVPIRRDTGTGRVDRCAECGKPNVMTYATNQPAVDSGRYCMVCWSAY